MIQGIENLVSCRTLPNGVKMPCVGFGTWQTPSGGVARDSVRKALEIGYRHLDTAAIYGNEADVGEGLRLSGVRREDVFVTTKHWTSERGFKKTLAAAEKSLMDMGLDYLDLYLIHWPAVKKCSADWEALNAETWQGFEKLYRDGKVRAIGISNFLPEHIDSLKANSDVMPMVNQIEFHPGYAQMECVKYCRENGILAEAWSPLGCGRLLSNGPVVKIAAAHGKSAAQVCIRYALQHALVPLPKSVHAERIAANAEVFDFELSPEEMAELDELPETGFSGFHPEEAPAG